MIDIYLTGDFVASSVYLGSNTRGQEGEVYQWDKMENTNRERDVNTRDLEEYFLPPY